MCLLTCLGLGRVDHIRERKDMRPPRIERERPTGACHEERLEGGRCEEWTDWEVAGARGRGGSGRSGGAGSKQSFGVALSSAGRMHAFRAGLRVPFAPAPPPLQKALPAGSIVLGD